MDARSRQIYMVLVDHYVKFGIFPSSIYLQKRLKIRSRSSLIAAIKELKDGGHIAEVDDGIELRHGMLSRMCPTDAKVIQKRIRVMEAAL